MPKPAIHHINSLPTETLAMIFASIDDLAERTQLEQVCRRWRKIVQPTWAYANKCPVPLLSRYSLALVALRAGQFLNELSLQEIVLDVRMAVKVFQSFPNLAHLNLHSCEMEDRAAKLIASNCEERLKTLNMCKTVFFQFGDQQGHNGGGSDCGPVSSCGRVDDQKKSCEESLNIKLTLRKTKESGYLYFRTKTSNIYSFFDKIYPFPSPPPFQSYRPSLGHFLGHGFRQLEHLAFSLSYDHSIRTVPDKLPSGLKSLAIESWSEYDVDICTLLRAARQHCPRLLALEIKVNELGVQNLAIIGQMQSLNSLVLDVTCTGANVHLSDCLHRLVNLRMLSFHHCWSLCLRTDWSFFPIDLLNFIRKFPKLRAIKVNSVADYDDGKFEHIENELLSAMNESVERGRTEQLVISLAYVGTSLRNRNINQPNTLWRENTVELVEPRSLLRIECILGTGNDKRKRTYSENGSNILMEEMATEMFGPREAQPFLQRLRHECHCTNHCN